MDQPPRPSSFPHDTKASRWIPALRYVLGVDAGCPLAELHERILFIPDLGHRSTQDFVSLHSTNPAKDIQLALPVVHVADRQYCSSAMIRFKLKKGTLSPKEELPPFIKNTAVFAAAAYVASQLSGYTPSKIALRQKLLHIITDYTDFHHDKRTWAHLDMLLNHSQQIEIDPNPVGVFPASSQKDIRNFLKLKPANIDELPLHRWNSAVVKEPGDEETSYLPEDVIEPIKKRWRRHPKHSRPSR